MTDGEKWAESLRMFQMPSENMTFGIRYYIWFNETDKKFEIKEDVKNTILYRSDSIIEIREKYNKLVEEWIEKNCFKGKLDKEVCIKCQKKNYKPKDVIKEEERIYNIETYIESKWQSDEGFQCSSETRKNIKNPYLGDCLYKLEHIMKWNNRKGEKDGYFF
jgi:hypothetical protein